MSPGDLVVVRHTITAAHKEIYDTPGLVLELNDRPFKVVPNPRGISHVSFLPNFWRKDPKEYMEGQAALVQWQNERRWCRVSDLEVICASR